MPQPDGRLDPGPAKGGESGNPLLTKISSEKKIGRFPAYVNRLGPLALYLVQLMGWRTLPKPSLIFEAS